MLDMILWGIGLWQVLEKGERYRGTKLLIRRDIEGQSLETAKMMDDLCDNLGALSWVLHKGWRAKEVILEKACSYSQSSRCQRETGCQRTDCLHGRDWVCS